MKKFFRIALIVLFALLFVGTFVFLYLNSQPKKEVFAIVSPSEGSITRTTVLTGKIEPRDEIAIKPQISGIITEIKVEAGETVKEGDVIAVIKVIPDAAQLSSAENRMNSARVSLDDATTKVERARNLFAKKVIAREELETAETTYLQAKNEYAGAKDALRVVREGVSAHNATESNTQVRATVSGMVLDVPVKVGTSVILSNTFNDGTTIATVADMSNLLFVGNVDETEVSGLSVGMPMEIIVGAASDVHPKGVIEYISPKGSTANGANTFEIKAALSDIPEGANLRAGYSANGTVILEKMEKGLTIPEAVVEYSADSTFVYVLTDSVEQKFKRTPVTLGISDGINVHVKKGITKKSRLRGAAAE